MGKKLDKLMSRIEAMEKAIAALVSGKAPQKSAKPEKKKTAAKSAKAHKPAKKTAKEPKKTKGVAQVAPVIGNL